MVLILRQNVFNFVYRMTGVVIVHRDEVIIMQLHVTKAGLTDRCTPPRRYLCELRPRVMGRGGVSG